jgi:hypothetical protein
MQPQPQNDLQRRVDSRLQVLRILWFALVMSVVLYFVLTVMTGQPKNPQPTAALSLGLLAAGIVFVVASIAFKANYVNRAIEQQSAVVLQQGYIVALALSEVAALFGLLDYFITGNRYYFANFIVAVCGQLYHFPRRQHVLDVSFRTPETTPARAYGEPVTNQDPTKPPLPPEF